MSETGKRAEGCDNELIIVMDNKDSNPQGPSERLKRTSELHHRIRDGQTSTCSHPPQLSDGVPCISSLPREKERPKNSLSNAGRWVCEMCTGNILRRPRNYREGQGNRASLIAQSVKNLPAMQENGV